MKDRDALRKGRLVAEVLRGAWRKSDQPPLEMSEADLDIVTPLLFDSGTAALGWHRVKHTQLMDSASGDLLHQAYRLQSLHSELQEQRIERVFRFLREAGIEAILAKGWAVASSYPDKILRPYGDIDICVRPNQFKRTGELLCSDELKECIVDLHQQFSEIDERTTAELFERSRAMTLRDEQIRVLGLEDQLALSSIHLLKHGAWRPLWLCDLGVMVENLPPDFDWDICLGPNPTRREWVLCAIGLAGQLLGADVSRTPSISQHVPAWLVGNVLKQWENPTAINQPPMSHPVPFSRLLRHPSGLIEGLRQRWPNPILATVSVNGRFNDYPRLPYQMANCVSRLGRVLFHRNGVHEH